MKIILGATHDPRFQNSFNKKLSFEASLKHEDGLLTALHFFFVLLFWCPAETGIILNLQTDLESGIYNVLLSVGDNLGLEQVSTLQVTVCDCTGEEVTCQGRTAAGTDLPLILGILAGILLLLSKSLFYTILIYKRAD